MFSSKIARAATVAVAAAGFAVVTALPAAAATAAGATVSSYLVIEAANVHTSPSHSSRVIKIKHPGDVVTSPLSCWHGQPDPDGTTLWIEVNLATGGVGWMGDGQLDPFCVQ